MFIQRLRALSSLMFLCIFGSGLSAQTCYVKAATTGTADCSNWANACTLPTALSPGSTCASIWVQAGTYSPIVLKSGVKLYGGFVGTETAASQSDPVAHVTTIDGAGATVVQCTNCSDQTVLRGFRIVNGGGATFDSSGGLTLRNSPIRVVNCIFENNHCGFAGCAALVDDSSAVFVNCRFANNGHKDNPDYPSFPNSRPYEPETLAGGAVWVRFSSPTFTNCLFFGNRADEGGAVVVSLASIATFRGCTFTQNAATLSDGGAVADGDGSIFYNTIIWGNTAAFGNPAIGDVSGAVVVEYSDVQGGWAGTGNLNVDPQFKDVAVGDYRIKFTSPCKNTGNNTYLDFNDPAHLEPDAGDLDWDINFSESTPLDLKGCPRKTGTVDMGAYEFHPTCNPAGGSN